VLLRTSHYPQPVWRMMLEQWLHQICVLLGADS